MSPVLTYIFLALCAVFFIAGFFLPTKHLSERWPKLSRMTWLLQIAALVGAYFILRPGHNTGDTNTIEASLARGEPVLLDFYSNY